MITMVAATAGSLAAGTLPPADQRVIVHDSDARSRPALSEEERALLDWGHERFATAGLALPDVVISFHPDLEPCRGNQGNYRPGTIARIRICRTSDGSPARDHLVRHAVLHELAHAWADHSLSGVARDEFIADRGASNWNDRSIAWHDRATEQAAEIIAWGLMDEEIAFLAIDDKSCDRLREGFLLLTGVEPTAGLQNSC